MAINDTPRDLQQVLIAMDGGSQWGTSGTAVKEHMG